MIGCELCHRNTVRGFGKLVEIGSDGHIHEVFICNDCETLIRNANEVDIEGGKIVAVTHRTESRR